jgi:hypothetical protein
MMQWKQNQLAVSGNIATCLSIAITMSIETHVYVKFHQKT